MMVAGTCGAMFAIPESYAESEMVTCTNCGCSGTTRENLADLCEVDQ